MPPIKYNTNRAELWVARYSDTNTDSPKGITTDTTGNIYITGVSYTDNATYDYTTVKYNTNGTEEWVAKHDSVGAGYDFAHAIAIDTNGNIYIAGESYSNISANDYALVVCRALPGDLRVSL